MSEYYWELIQFDDTRIEIPPSGVEVVKRRMANGEPINTRTSVIPVNQIKHFRQTDKLFSEQPLIDAVARAFNDPQLTEDDSIKARWVKKQVTGQSYAKHYSNIPAYRRLGTEGPMVTIAFKLPVHLIDVNTTTYCDESEIAQLTQKH